ncbi:MAG TPA: permease [Gemmatimonadales bacterium]|nr:permease [Gemmatimonadales bacterium]
MDIGMELLEVLRTIVGMGWKIAWGLSLGFLISAVVQTYVSKERIAEALGTVTFKSLGLASFFGFASSSCSYAAAAMSKTLFQKGADFVTATAFLIASTNLVIEIGLVIWVMLGWQFVLAELVGGFLLIAIAAILLKWFAPKRIFEAAREHLAHATAAHDHDHGGGGRGLPAIAHYFAMDVSMIAKDIVLGLVIAGALAALVPQSWWHTLFLAPASGAPGLFVTIENAVVGPLIAVLSFVCSVGNIPLAAVLWHGGSAFGGVIAFIFADLVTIPMVLVYRRYYGWKPALTYAAYLFVTMVVAGLIVDGVFRVTGLVPSPAASPALRSMRYFSWDYTTWLNVVFLPLAAFLYWRGRRAHRAAMSTMAHGHHAH